MNTNLVTGVLHLADENFGEGLRSSLARLMAVAPLALAGAGFSCAAPESGESREQHSLESAASLPLNSDVPVKIELVRKPNDDSHIMETLARVRFQDEGTFDISTTVNGETVHQAFTMPGKNPEALLMLGLNPMQIRIVHSPTIDKPCSYVDLSYEPDALTDGLGIGQGLLRVTGPGQKLAFSVSNFSSRPAPVASR